jgi:cytochrome c553
MSLKVTFYMQVSKIVHFIILNFSNIRIFVLIFHWVREINFLTMYNSATNFFTEGRMKKLIIMLLLILFGSSAMAAGDIGKGKIKSFTCTGCHGIPFYKNAYPNYHVPRLGGQNEAYIVSALKAYRSGERSHKTMQAQAGSLSDQDIADIAAYFASLK